MREESKIMSSHKWSHPGTIIPVMAVSACALLAGAALADPPPADTVIGNQAAATYVSNGEEITVQSNIVETVVNEIFAVELNSSQSRSAAPGGFAFFPHTLVNNANTDDIFDLTVDATPGSDGFAFTDILIFPDADQDGVPDTLTPISVTPSILAGGSFGVVVRAAVPASANAAQISDFDLTATSQGSLEDGDASTDQSATNTDTAEVTTAGIIDLQKDQVLQDDADANGVFSVGDTVRATLTYTNSGIADATTVEISDTLPSVNIDGDAVLLTYVAGSGSWSDAPGIVLTEGATDTDAINAQGASIDYSFDGVLTIDALIDNVPAGRSGTISFDYVITDVPRGEIVNIASVETSAQPLSNSNGSPIDVASVARIIVADAEGTDNTGVDIQVGADESGTNLLATNISTTDSDLAVDDQITDDSRVFAGGSIVFDVVLTNLGNDTDTINLSLDNTSFPAGTVFDFVADDGVTPIIGDSVSLASGEVIHVQVVASLPATTPETVAPAGFEATVTATSQADGSVTNDTGIVFDGEVVVPGVDLANTDGSGAPTTGIGAGNEDDGGNPFVTNVTDPGEQITFDLQVALLPGDPANSFNLGVDDLPEGWTVEFFLPDGTPIQNTGALIPTDTDGAGVDYIAVVTVPEGTPPGEEPLLFTATSPSNGASDAVLNAVSVNEIVDLSLAANTDVQAAPGGVAVIAHTITNLGNSTVTGGALDLGGSDPFSDQGLAAALFYDANDNGELDATDPLISDLDAIIGVDGVPGLAPGEDARVFVRVQVPATSGLGLVETGDLAIADDVSTENGAATDSELSNNAVLDSVAIISGDITLVKEQSLDAACDGTADSGFTRSRQQADPGQCIVYLLQADNTGTNDATDLILRDIVPAFTTFETCGGACEPNLNIDGSAGTVASFPNDEDSGSIATALPGAGFTLSPGSRAELTFTVQIDE